MTSTAPASRPTTPSPLGEWWWLVVMFGALAAAKIVRTAWVPAGAHFACNLAMGAAVIVTGRLAGLTADEWGLSRSTWARGARWGGVVYLTVAVAAGLFAVAAGSSTAFDRGRNDLTGAELAMSVLVVIPVGTVVVEELAFRGLLLGWSCRLMSVRAAIGVNAVLFGAWHVVDAWGLPWWEVLGIVVATGLAGVGFGWLRLRSGSVLAPAIAHLATNTIPLTVAWLVTRS